MKTLIITVVVVTTAILSPIVGMGITQTREAILGLAPDEAVLELADKIDQSNVKVDATNAVVDSLSTKITEQNAKIVDSQVQLGEQVAKTQTIIATTKDACTTSIETACTDERFKSKSEFNDMVNEIKVVMNRKAS